MGCLLYSWSKSLSQAGIMLDSIPAPGDEFSFSILVSWFESSSNAPRPSPNPSQFIFSI